MPALPWGGWDIGWGGEQWDGSRRWFATTQLGEEPHRSCGPRWLSGCPNGLSATASGLPSLTWKTPSPRPLHLQTKEQELPIDDFWCQDKAEGCVYRGASLLYLPPRQSSAERRKGAGDMFQRQGACLVYKAPEFSPQHHMNWVMLLIPVLRR